MTASPSSVTDVVTASTVLDPDHHGRLIALAGLTDIRSDTLTRMLRAHSVRYLWDTLRAGRTLLLPRKDDKLVALPEARRDQWGAELRRVDIAALTQAHAAAGVQVLEVDQPSYPAALSRSVDPPGVLFAKGDVSLLHDTSATSAPTRRVAIVGTRRATTYGRQVARMLGRDLSAAGVGVVSGLASGIDGAAHAGALANLASDDARPIAVVGSGLDQIYPSVNRSLWADVCAQGVVVSEWPLGARPISWHFPARNRIIVELSHAVVVVESAVKGGSMITVRAAQERGVPVLSVPGPITSAVSVGPLQMLSEGGAVCRDVEDVLAAVGLTASGSSRSGSGGGDRRRVPSADGAGVLCALGWDVLPVERLLGRLPGTAPGALLLVLHELEFDGWVARGSDGWFQLASAPGR